MIKNLILGQSVIIASENLVPNPNPKSKKHMVELQYALQWLREHKGHSAATNFSKKYSNKKSDRHYSTEDHKKAALHHQEKMMDYQDIVDKDMKRDYANTIETDRAIHLKRNPHLKEQQDKADYHEKLYNHHANKMKR